MPLLVAFASLPFGIRERTYTVHGTSGQLTVHVSEQKFSPLIAVSPSGSATDDAPPTDPWSTTYTWYDHPFVLQVIFGVDHATLGSINSTATVIRRLAEGIALDDLALLEPQRDAFASDALEALNNLVALVRRRARLYHVGDLRREDIDLTVRADDGSVLLEDPLQDELIRAEEARTETFDLSHESTAWYRELDRALRSRQTVDLADELLIEAERALAQRFPRQTIASCHTTIEAAASALLTIGMQRRGMQDEQIDHLLSTRSLTSKLAALMGTYCGFNLRNDNRTLWQDFGQLNDLRNDTVHRGRRPSHEEAQAAIETTRKLLGWLRMVRMRNRNAPAMRSTAGQP